MIYVAAAREVWTRLKFHTTKPITGEERPLLEGLKAVKSAEFRVDKTDSLPLASLVDLTGREPAGHSEARVTMFLKTDRKKDLFAHDPSAGPGLLEWLERLQDAVETAPSSGQVDKLLTLHKADGTPALVNGRPYELLSEAFTWDFRMSEITELSFMMELDVVFTVPRGDRGNRKVSPIVAAAYFA